MADLADGREADGRESGDRPSAVEVVSVAALDPTEVRECVAAFHARHGDELRRFILGVTRDPDLTADVVQATLAKALECGHEARPETLKGWIFQVAFHEALAIRRRSKTGGLALRKLADAGRSADALPDSLLLREETASTVRKALHSLPGSQREVVIARVYDGKSFAQIASDAGLPLGTVLTRMRLALDKLRRVLRVDE